MRPVKEQENTSQQKRVHVPMDQLAERAEARLAAALQKLPVRNMSKQDLKAWLDEEEY